MDRKIRIILLLGALLVVLTLLFISGSAIIKNSGSAVSDTTEINHTWTKAICNSNNYCQDYEISCSNNKFISITPTGAIIHFSENWKDPRDKEAIDRVC